MKDEEKVEEQCKVRRHGRNGQCYFWCGFCQEFVKVDKRGREAWGQRFDHIDDMHFSKGQRVEDWFPIDKECPKGMLKPCKDDDDDEEELEDGVSDVEDGDGDSGDDVEEPAAPRMTASKSSPSRSSEQRAADRQPANDQSQSQAHIGILRPTSNLRHAQPMQWQWRCVSRPFLARTTPGQLRKILSNMIFPTLRTTLLT